MNMLRVSSITFLMVLLFLVASSSAAHAESTVYVTFWFDTEDFILPQADDAAKRLAEMFTERGVQATFKIVGEKARVLAERGRDDVILALAQNDIGYHSTDHSVHPTPSEYSRDLDWHEGVSEFIRREEPGLQVLRRVFGVSASCYGQPGGSWTPQSYAALNAFGIPVYLDDTSHVNLNDRPFRYCGVLTILELGDAVMRTGWTDEAVEQACARFDRVSEKLAGEGGGIISIYYHPCEFVHRQFWDGVNFSRGANPPRSQWKLPPMKSPAEQEQAFGAFETYLDHIVGHDGVRVVTAREIASLYPDKAFTRSLARRDIDIISRAFAEHLSYVDLGSRCVSAAEGLLALARFAVGMDEEGGPEAVETQFAYGPASRAQRFVTERVFSWEAIREAAQALLDAVAQTEQLPSVVWVAGQPVRPEDFAVTLASVVASGHRMEEVTLRRGDLEAERYVADNGPRLWGWVIFPEGFDAPGMMEIAKLQAWTIKPAVLRHAN